MIYMFIRHCCYHLIYCFSVYGVPCDIFSPFMFISVTFGILFLICYQKSDSWVIRYYLPEE